MKSARERARTAARKFAPTEVPQRNNCRAITRFVSELGKASVNLTTRTPN
jgi:hypothetical protein